MQGFLKSTSILAYEFRLGSLRYVSDKLRRLVFLSHKRNMTIAMSTHQTDSRTFSQSENNVYVQHSEKAEMMTISFEYSTSGKTKSFNLYRKANEPLAASLERLKLNLLKMRKVKKSKGTGREAQADEGQLDLSIVIDGKKLNPDMTTNVAAWIEGATLHLEDLSYTVKRNEPQVVTMKLPSIIMKGFIIVPDINLANCELQNCRLRWYRQISAQEREDLLTADNSLADKIELNQVYWLHLTDGLTYSPNEEDIAHYLKVVCIPSDGSKVGPTYSCLSSRPVELGPPVCPFEKRQTYTQKKSLHSTQLRIVSYNILADLYADSDYSRKVLFAYCPPHALDIDYRRQLLLREIHGYNADIVCLQEVDRKEFIKTYKPYFGLVSNYDGIYNTKGGQVAEGVATFFQADRFKLINTHRTILSNLIDPLVSEEENKDEELDNDAAHPILNDLSSKAAQDLLSCFVDIRSAIKRNPNLSKRFLNRHTIIQTSLLKMTDTSNRYLIVANTHLYFAPDADHVRLLQGSVCVKYLEFLKTFYRSKIAEELNDLKPDISILFCGDMNSTPDCGLFRLLHNGEVPEDLPDWKSHPEEAVEGLSISTRLRLRSAYQDIPYTNFTPGFHGWLDYIYYETNGIDCESTVPLPEHEDVIANDGIPSDVFPSDHLALIANLKLKT